MNKRFRPALLAAASLVALAAAAPAFAGKTLDAVKQRGTVKCGVTNGVAGFSAPDTQGNWSGLDVDTCRAIAAAVLGDGKKVDFVPLNSQQRFSALQAGEIDILARNTTWTLTRDASLGFNFTTITYYDGQGFLVPKKLKVTSAKQLKNATICTQSGTTNEKNVSDYFRAQGIPVKTVVFESFEASFKAFFSGRCQAFTTDASALAGLRNKEAPNPDDYLILPELISKEPLARWCAAATTSGSPLPSGCPTRSSKPRKPASRRPMPTSSRPTARTRRSSAWSAPVKTSASCWAWTRTGRSAPSRPWAITARCSSATSGPSRC
jgi:general L-amino acid transport system substrate-binding protein